MRRLQLNNKDETACLELLQCVYCEVLLLNCNGYYYENCQSHQNYEEFGHAITSSEKMLIKRIKRVVIRGKRDRGVPVLLFKCSGEHQTIIEVHIKFPRTWKPLFIWQPKFYNTYIWVESYSKWCEVMCPILRVGKSW